MVTVTRTLNKGQGTFYFALKKDPDIHQTICSFLSQLGFSDEDVLEADFPMDDPTLNDTPIIVQNHDYLISVIVGESKVHITIHTLRSNTKLKQALRTSFGLAFD